MIDENYHIADLDDMEYHEESIGEIKIKEKPVIRTKVIYENSDTSREEYNDREAGFFEENQKFNREKFYSEDSDNENRENTTSKNVSRKKNLLEEYFWDSYNKRPNTLKATVVGIILAVLILLIGFPKTLLIFIVVLLANIVGQFLDNNPRILSIIDLISRRLK